MAATCPVCGGDVKASWKFCVRCGTAATAVKDPSSPAPRPAAERQPQPQPQSADVEPPQPRPDAEPDPREPPQRRPPRQRLPELADTFTKATKAYGAPVRTRGAGRKRRLPPSSAVNERGRLLLLQRQRELEQAQRTRTKQEKMVALLEMNNVLSRDSELGLRSSGE